MYAMSEVGFPTSGKKLIDSGPPEMKKAGATALDRILQDLLKKARDTERGLAMAHISALALDAPDVEFQTTGNLRRGPDESVHTMVELELRCRPHLTWQNGLWSEAGNRPLLYSICHM